MIFRGLRTAVGLLSLIGAAQATLQVRDGDDGSSSNCTVRSSGPGGDDTDNFENAIKQCGKGGLIYLPDANYTISRPLELYLENAEVDLHGYLTFTADVDYWVQNHIPFEFQNQSLAMTWSGSNFTLNGNGIGGFDGNGQVWYDTFKTHGNSYGRPMPLAIVNATDVRIMDWRVVQPQFWAALVSQSSNVYFKNFYTNATNFNPESDSDEKHWLQNTDGIDFYRSDNITIDGMTSQGSDDCVGFKANSTNVYLSNITCWGGTGIAFGSVGQYPGVTDIIENVTITDSNFYASNQCPIYEAIYFKSWIGTYYGHPPNGGGGGQGYCRNVNLNNIHSEGAYFPVSVQTTLSYTANVPDSVKTQSLYSWDSVHLSNWTGTSKGNRLINFSCSENLPCRGWTFRDFNVQPGWNNKTEVNYICNNMVINGTTGIDMCHPSNLTHGLM